MTWAGGRGQGNWSIPAPAPTPPAATKPSACPQAGRRTLMLRLLFLRPVSCLMLLSVSCKRCFHVLGTSTEEHESGSDFSVPCAVAEKSQPRCS